MMSEAVNGLAKKFNPPEHYYSAQKQEAQYKLLPFNFERVGDSYLLTNEVGEYLFLSEADLHSLVHETLDSQSEVYSSLKSRHFLYEVGSESAIELLSLKLRTKHAVFRQFTSLHIFVVSLRCDYSCPYCQVSRQTEDADKYDMDEETALRSLDFVFRTPSEHIKIEFQGGEPLLNWEIIKFTVLEAEKINKTEKRDLAFVIATNLTLISDEILEFCYQHDVFISTSLDGPAHVHNRNRPRPGKDGHQIVRDQIERVREKLGPDRISALMTTSELSLSHPREIIDEYLDADFKGIFLRPLSPYGFAVKTHQIEKYDFERFFEFYQDSMEYIFEINEAGIPFVEEFSALLLRKISLPYPTGYVDLQSPAGAGVSAIVFNYDGDVYASDESRMLAEMGDYKFRLGNILSNTYEEIFLESGLLEILEETLTDSVPECYQCAYKPYCGSEPVYHYATQKDPVGNKALSGFCTKTKTITNYLLDIMENDPARRQILQSWI
ncbi:His-Xaa-Ser system radical SAM maturase HxsB [Marinobacter salsuginis]|uniref:His-Xaa-Ser system radical SAM maturase HxsB n=1 Tax=Marinobacter salsuginis TaxID=418719 RepID=UPI00273D5806|nr:His-Xaa-Ser system radical SAM maturase HxsB [Marinobacter salsuginis]